MQANQNPQALAAVLAGVSAMLVSANVPTDRINQVVSIIEGRAAALFDKSETTIRRWAREGRLTRFYVRGSQRAVGIDASSIPGYGKEAHQ